jgi:methylenetetrahydrofolate dehydrogenase (NADP+) / methenyltetrahydrofolate cyclohydrolase
MIIDTKLIKEKLIEDLKNKIKRVPKQLTFDIVLSTDNSASKKYVQKKVEFGANIGVQVNVHKKFEDINIENSDGIIIQLPATIDQEKLIQNIPIHLDVDLLKHRDELMKLGIYPPTIKGIIQIMDNPKDLKGKNIIIIGQGTLIGKPLIDAMLTYNSTIISCNEYTHNIKEFTKLGYIIVSGTGVANLIDESYINTEKPQIWIDAGTTESHGKIVGDINKIVGDYSNIRLCPSPGGIGPLTVVNIFHNLVDMFILRSIINSEEIKL